MILAFFTIPEYNLELNKFLHEFQKHFEKHLTSTTRPRITASPKLRSVCVDRPTVIFAMLLSIWVQFHTKGHFT